MGRIFLEAEHFSSYSESTVTLGVNQQPETWNPRDAADRRTHDMALGDPESSNFLSADRVAATKTSQLAT